MMEKNKSKMACQADGRMGGFGAFCRVKGSREDLKNEIMRDVKGGITLFLSLRGVQEACLALIVFCLLIVLL